MTAAEQWADELAAWRIDPEILAAAPESPYGFPPALFAPRDDVGSPLLDLTRAALPPGGTVLDVGAGAGAGSLGLGEAVGRVHAVDSQPSMLRALEATAAERGVPVTTYDGVWPDVAATVPVCDVVVCAHVVYNVPDLVPFVTALTRHARRLVVVEMTGAHPLVRLGPMWEAVHGQSRPRGPTAELAMAVLRESGIAPTVAEVVRDPAVRAGALREAWVDFTRRQLCLPPERRAEVERLMERHPPTPRRSVILSWPGGAAG
ncbi:MAG TPA: methyltransferase domain-containing protein [Actinomycetes bacterium]|nr:methyltransferase domain-containing protein [Actinomycetes bacterium]